MKLQAKLLDGLAVAAVAVLLLWPALLNGYPLIFSDSALYIALSFAPHDYPPRSLPYPVLLYGLHLGWSLWSVIVFQAVATAWLLHEATAAFADRHRALWLIFLGIVLTVLTGLPWTVDQVMPDFFSGLVAFAIILTALSPDRFSLIRRILLYAIVTVGVAAHPTHAAIALALLLASAIILMMLRLPARGLLGSLVATTAGIVLTIAIHFAITGQAYFSQGGQQFIFGRLVGDGIVADYLNEVCPRPDLSLCKMKDRLPQSHNEYLWLDRDAFLQLGGWDPKPELRSILWDSLRLMPLRHLTAAISATAHQLVSIDVGESLQRSGKLATQILETAFPGDSGALHASLQQRDRLAPILAFLNTFQHPIQLVMLAALPLLAGWFGWHGRRCLAGFCLTVLAALMINAAICGIFSGVTERYQNRVAWIAVAAVSLVAARRRDTSAERQLSYS